MVSKGRDTRLRSVGNDEREQTLNQLLTELDGFESEKDAGPVICIAATNRPDVSWPKFLIYLPCPECHWESSLLGRPGTAAGSRHARRLEMQQTL